LPDSLEQLSAVERGALQGSPLSQPTTFSSGGSNRTIPGSVVDQSFAGNNAQLRQIRQKVNELLLTKFGSKTVADATKQYNSEYYKLLAVCYTDALKRPESFDVSVGGAEGIRNIAYQYTRKLGVDLKKLRLTDAGFQKI
jgi:hypothetical protein